MAATRHWKKLVLTIALVIVLCTTLVASPVLARWGEGACGGGGGCGGGGYNGGSTTPLSTYEKQALAIAIDEEYKAKAVYEEVMSVYGPISPFYWIARNEQMHINWVANLLVKYGLTIPGDLWTGNVSLDLTSRHQACEIGAQAEFDNAAIYDQMMPQITHVDIISTFSKLRDVSQYRHLPAFQEWAATYAAAGE